MHHLPRYITPQPRTTHKTQSIPQLPLFTQNLPHITQQHLCITPLQRCITNQQQCITNQQQCITNQQRGITSQQQCIINQRLSTTPPSKTVLLLTKSSKLRSAPPHLKPSAPLL